MKLALLAPDPADKGFVETAQRPTAEYTALLAAVGIALAPVPWTAPPPPDVAGALALTAWGYHLAPARWQAALAAWEGRGLANAPAILAWNTRKTYLADLEAAGVATVPTVFAPNADAAALAAARARFGPGRLVVKPQVSADAHATTVHAPGDPAPGLADAMIQPMLDTIATWGELSLILFDGAFSHAVRKVPRAGDFRVQEERGGIFTRVGPDADALALAAAALACAPAPPLYARVDCVRLPAGSLAIMELELIEPDLYLHHAPDRAPALAAAVRNALA